MKEWQVTLGGALVMFASGIIMFLWANSLEIPATFLVVNEYVLVSDQYFVTSQTGALFTGFGGGLLICTPPDLPARKETRIQITNHINRERLNSS